MMSAPAIAASLAVAIATPSTPVFLPVPEAERLVMAGATVLDARGSRADGPYLPGAVVIDWLAFRDGWLRSGRLDDNAASVRERLEALGVTSNDPVLVYGDMAKGWGDEGRIWWMLRYLGHPRVAILDGGIAAWRHAGLELRPDPAEPRRRGPLSVRRQGALRADWTDVDRLHRQKDARILDVRRREEFDGATPYLSSRGGHIPGAVHLHWAELIGPDGTLLSTDTVRGKLAAVGVTRAHRVITYCTGGVRSAFVQAVLLHAGFSDVANYDGSWWDWSSRESLPVAR